METLDQIYDDARNAPKRSYRIYEQFKRRIEALGLSADGYLRAVLRLANILKV